MYFFGPDYEERSTLRDGTPVVIRMVRPDDKERLRRGFHRLSPEARYLRFFTPKTDLSEDELRYLTEIDGVRHVALGAVRAGDDEDGLGVARFIVLDDTPGTAEAAVAVLDEVQGQGLGTLLFLRLLAAARERGVSRVRCELLGSNKAMTDLLKTLAPERTIQVEAGVVSIELLLPEVAPAQPPAEPPREAALYKIFTMIARGALDWRDAVAKLALRGKSPES